MAFSLSIFVLEVIDLSQPPFETCLAHLELLDDAPNFSDPSTVALESSFLCLVFGDDVKVLQDVQMAESAENSLLD